MMNNGDRVIIKNTNSIFDDKEGILEQIIQEDDSTMCTVFVEFLPEEGKKIRQNFDIANVQPLTEGKNKNKNKNKGNGDKEQKSNPCDNYDLSSLKPLVDVIPQLSNSYQKEVMVSSYFDKYLQECYNSVLYSKELRTDFYTLVERACKRINKFCRFEGYEQPPINGVSEFYASKVKELKVGVINNNQIRILYFVVCDKIIFTSVFVHKQQALTYQEKTSSFRCVDSVYKGNTKK